MFEQYEPIIEAIQEAGDKVLHYYEVGAEQYTKSDSSPFTDADIASEQCILTAIKQTFPDHGIVAEESGQEDWEKEWVWFVDPLDGTKDFICRTDEFSILVGLAHKGTPVFGMIYVPVLQKLYIAEEGRGAWLWEQEGQKRLQIIPPASLEDAVLGCSRFHAKPELLEVFESIGVTNQIPTGSIGVKVGLIAEGEQDIYANISAKSNTWDTCAPEIVIKEAGGCLTDLNGDPLVYHKERVANIYGVLGAHPEIQKQLYDPLQPFYTSLKEKE